VSVIRATSLSGYPRLVADLGGDPAELLRAVGVRPQDVGKHDVFLPYRSVIVAIESAAAATATQDFGRRLALRQGIEILGPVGVAAVPRRPSPTRSRFSRLTFPPIARPSPRGSPRALTPGSRSTHSRF
jgi:hypothetical protein